MSMFNSKQRQTTLAKFAVPLSGITTASVYMKQLAWCDNSISQINTLIKVKPDAAGASKAIDTLMELKTRINTAIQPPVTQLPKTDQKEPSVSEGPSFNRRP